MTDKYKIRIELELDFASANARDIAISKIKSTINSWQEALPANAAFSISNLSKWDELDKQITTITRVNKESVTLI